MTLSWYFVLGLHLTIVIMQNYSEVLNIEYIGASFRGAVNDC